MDERTTLSLEPELVTETSGQFSKIINLCRVPGHHGPGQWIEGFVGQSDAVATALRFVQRIAQSNLPVLITGETGTGKEICARGIHQASPRRGKPFVPVNCASIPEHLMENELFGHKQGAYTGARCDFDGLLAQANGGTLLLDEVDALSLASQSKLLRFLDDQELRALGSSRQRKVDVRILATTNANLDHLRSQKRFRDDFYFRLSGASISLPPLRERQGDILLLADHFLRTLEGCSSPLMRGFSVQATQKLNTYHWPGNVRELKYVITRAVLLHPEANDGALESESIELPSQRPPARIGPYSETRRARMQRHEKSTLVGYLIAHQGNVFRAAHAAGLDRRWFYRLMRKHGIEPKTFRTSVAEGDARL